MIHGELEVEVVEARNLPDTDRFLFNMFSKDVTDPYVSGYLDDTKVNLSAFKMVHYKNRFPRCL